jgi:hypothetical protein
LELFVREVKEVSLKNIIILFSFFFSSIVFAADTLTVTAQAAASTVSLITTQTNLIVAKSTVGTSGTSASPKTYNLLVTSQNGGLKNANAITKGASAASATLPYTLTWATTTGTVTSSSTLTINSTTQQTLVNKVDGSGGGSSFAGNILLTRTGTAAASLYSGTYTDVLTITATNVTNSTSIVKTFTITTAAVADTITIYVTPSAAASSLTLTSSQTQLAVGTINITSNCQNGYLVQLSSANAGKLVHTLAGASPNANEFINYQLFYLGSQVSTTVAPVTIATNNAATLITTTTQIGDVGISYTGVSQSNMRAGTLQDNLTFTLQSQ